MKLLKLIAPLFFLLASTHASATPFKINFTGSLESLTTYGVIGVNDIDSVFSISDSVFGEISVDALGAISQFDLTIGSYTASANTGSAGIRNDYQAGVSAPVVDSILISSYSGFTGAAINGLNISRLQFSVGTENLSTIDALSTVGPVEILDLWNDTPNYFSGNLNFLAFDNGETARFSLASVSVSPISTTPIPEPSILALFTFGIVALGFTNRRKKT